MVDWNEVAKVGLIFDAVSGGLFMALGIVVLLQRPWRRVPVLFGLFAFGFGTAYLLGNLTKEPLAVMNRWWYAAIIPPGFVATFAITRLGFLFPGRKGAVRPMYVGLAGALALLLLVTLQVVVTPLNALVDPDLPTWVSFLGTLANYGPVAGILFAAILWTLRLPMLSAHAAADRLRQLIIASFALALFIPVMSGILLLNISSLVDLGSHPAAVWMMALGWTVSSLMLVASMLWMTSKFERPLSAVLRNTAIGLAGALLVGALFGLVTVRSIQAFDLGLLGVTRTVGFVIFAYQILKHQLLGSDLVFRFAISKGTVAAIFVAVFFVVSTVASEWLVETWGYSLGGIAAGLMLFAINPLQKIGEKVASTALPDARPIAERTEEDRMAFYRDLALDVWADGHVGAKERDILDHAAQRLGLSAESILKIEREAARA